MTRGHAVPQPHLTTSRISRGLAMMVTSAVITISPVEAQDRVFTSDIALDVRTARIAAVTEDGARVAVTVQTRRDRTDVDHQRYGDPTYVSPVSTRLMVIDTRSGEQTWVHEQPTSLRGYTWSPDGEHLAYFAHGEDGYSLRVFDASASRSSTRRSHSDATSASVASIPASNASTASPSIRATSSAS